MTSIFRIQLMSPRSVILKQELSSFLVLLMRLRVRKDQIVIHIDRDDEVVTIDILIENAVISLDASEAEGLKLT